MTNDKKVISYLNANQFDAAIDLMSIWNNEQLALFQFHHSTLLSTLKSSVFDDFWQKKRAELRLPNNPDFRFLAQPMIHDADLVTGYLLYLLELKPQQAGRLINNNDGGFKATDFLSIHLVRLRLLRLYHVLEQATEKDLEKLSRILFNLEGFAKVQGCPGYLLLADGYVQLALRYQKKQQEVECKAAYQLCWKYLHLATLSEPDSEESINNAYFGKGIVLSNPFKLNTIAEMKDYCRKAADVLLPLVTQAGEEQLAKKMYGAGQRLADPGQGVSLSGM